MEQSPTPAPRKEDDVLKNKDIAALSYLYVASVIVFFFRAKDSTFIRFHSKQAMVLFAVCILALFLPFPFGFILQLLVLLGCITGFVMAAHGRWWEIPFIGALARGEVNQRESWKQTVDMIANVTGTIGEKKETHHTDATNPPPTHP